MHVITATLAKRIAAIANFGQGLTLLDCTVKVIKNAFKKLPPATLQQLGCSIVRGADKTVVRANDDDIEALVHKSLGANGDGVTVVKA